MRTGCRMMVRSRRYRVSGTLLVFLTCLGLAFGSSGASAADDAVDSNIRSDEAAGAVPSRLLSERSLAAAFEGSGGRVTIEIVFASGVDRAVVAEVGRLGGRVLSESSGLILAEPLTPVRMAAGGVILAGIVWGTSPEPSD